MWTLQDAKNRFSAVVDAALAGQPQEVSRRGKPAVVVLAADEYRRMLDRARQGRESFAAHLLAFPGAGPDADGGPDADPDSGPDSGPALPRAQSRPRDVSF